VVYNETDKSNHTAGMPGSSLNIPQSRTLPCHFATL